MGVKINHGRIKPKKESTFGKKVPFKGKNKNRSGNKLKTNYTASKSINSQSRNPLSLYSFYVYMRDLANDVGCDAHHWIPKSKLKQDIFLAFVPYDEHRAIHAAGNSQNPLQWSESQGIDNLVYSSMNHFERWANDNNLADEYFLLIEHLRADPFNCHDIARDFILNNRNL